MGGGSCVMGELIEQFFDELGFTNTAQTLFDAPTFLGLVPEEILALSQFLLLALGTLDGFEGIRVIARIPCLGGNGHGCRCKILNLFKLEIEMFGDDSQLSHVSLPATWMAGDEVGDDLLVEMLLTVDAVEDTLELVELLERWLAHQLQYMVAGMLGSYLQASADMVLDQFAGVLHSGLVRLLVLAVIQQQVVAYTTADKTFLDAWQSVDSTVYLQQL